MAECIFFLIRFMYTLFPGGVILMSKAAVKHPPVPVFKVDRPFLFYITVKLYANERTILFMGKVLSPG